MICLGLVRIMGKMRGFLRNHLTDDSSLCCPLTSMVHVEAGVSKHVVLMQRTSQALFR